MSILSTIIGGLCTIIGGLITVWCRNFIENKRKVQQVEEQLRFLIPKLHFCVEKINQLTDLNSAIWGDQNHSLGFLPNGLELWNSKTELKHNDLSTNEDIFNTFIDEGVKLKESQITTIKNFLKYTYTKNKTQDQIPSNLMIILKTSEEIIQQISTSLYLMNDEKRQLIHELNTYIHYFLNSLQKIPNTDAYKLTITNYYFVFHIIIYQLELILNKK
ncbi:TPA: hypothetical protein OYN25_000022 [Staphylococcus aureus]|nr:hypothetical protein [Staphylococcus aureus]HCX0088230.1 hypothetical protein [Staphylococcus aureus]